METDRGSRNSASIERKRCFRDLLHKIEEIQESDDVGAQTIEELGRILKEVNSIDDQCDIEERIQYTDETLLETTVLSSASGVLVKCIENLDIFTSTYEPAEFANKLLHTLGSSEEPSWLNLLEDACSIIPDVPSFAFLSGTFDPSKLPEAKQRKERQKREAQEKVEKKQLQKISTTDKDKECLDDTVNFLKELLTAQYEKNKCEPIPYFDFVVDSESFASTVENIFYTSFLLRDGKAKIEITEDGVPVLQPMRKRDLQTFREEGGTNVQMISSITMDIWETLKVKEGIIQQQKKRKKAKK